MKKYMIFIMMILLAGAAYAYPVSMVIESLDGDFHTTVYTCADTMCYDLEEQTADTYGNPNNYLIPDLGSGVRYSAEYNYKECYLPWANRKDTSPTTGYGPWHYTVDFSKGSGCASRFNSIDISDDTPAYADTVTVSAEIMSSHVISDQGAQSIPESIEDYYSSVVDVYFYVDDQYVEQKQVNIVFGETTTVEFEHEISHTGQYNFSIWTKMDNDCKCTSSYWQHRYAYAEVEEECTQDSDCNYLDNDYCDADDVYHTEGVCENYECQTQESFVEDCNDYDTSYCSGDDILSEDYTCLMAQCTLFSSSTIDCDDGLYCNGEETCDAAQCESGTPVDCSANDICGIATCDNDPDANPFTWDYREEFVSECDESTDSCTQGDETISFECSTANCGAECELDSDCDSNSCEESYDDYCEGYELVDYDGDRIKDSTTVSASCENTCDSCVCTDCAVDCSAPAPYQYCSIECGAECDSQNPCDDTDCDYLDGCVGDDYYDYADVENSCLGSCECEQNSCESPIIFENDPRCTECQTDDDCDYLDEDYCESDTVMHKEGVCQDYQCTVMVEEIEECDYLDNQYCSGSELIFEDYSCQNAECVVTGSGGFDCNDGLYCNGEEGCEVDQCMPGEQVDCSSNNKDEIATCDNDPDNNPFTWDYREEFVSECDEITDSCTQGDETISSECSTSKCDAECETDSDCGLQGSCVDCGCEYDYFCGDGLVIGQEECEYPNTQDNQYCSQPTEECDGYYFGTRDSYGNCDSVCGCVEDNFEYALVIGKCGVECIEDEDCDDDNPLTLDWCEDYQCNYEETDCDYNYVSDPKAKIHIDRIGFVQDEFVKAGDELTIVVSFKNMGYCEMKSTKIEAFIPWIPAKSRRLGPMSVNADGEITKDLIIEIPEHTPPGFYDVRLDIYNQGLRRTRHRPIFVY
ncbi:MAG: hypothetical protein MAG795_00353 [Candidatus Woesearchaeota archaeon]|nr:hypothetical protein [Candidatus Woesearchaeota archaeon]